MVIIQATNNHHKRSYSGSLWPLEPDLEAEDHGEAKDDVTVLYGFDCDPKIRIKDDTGPILQGWIDTGPIL